MLNKKPAMNKKSGMGKKKKAHCNSLYIKQK